MSVHQETPGYRIMPRNGEIPGAPNAPRTPHAPRMPHVPYLREATLAVAVILSTTAAGLAIDKASQKFSESQSQPQTQPRAGEVDAELMRYPYDSRNQPIKLSIDSSSGEPIKEWTSAPQVLTAESGDGAVSYYVSFLGDSYDNPTNPDDPFGHVKITLLNEVMQGGVWLEETDVNGNSLVDSNGLVTLWKPYQVENLQIPEQAPAPVTG